MNSKAMQTVWKLQHLNFALMSLSRTAQHLKFREIKQTYATGARTSIFGSLAPKLGENVLIRLKREDQQTRLNFSAVRALSIEILLHRLRTQYQHNGSLNGDYFESLLQVLESKPESYNQLLTEEHTHYLLHACGTQLPTRTADKRLQLFQRFWDYLAQHAQLTKKDYITHLQVLQHNRAPLVNFREFVNQLAQLDAAATKSHELYSELLAVACCSGNMRQATEVLADMRDQQFALTERNFNSLILGHLRNHNLQGCQTVLESMLASGIAPSNETQAMLVVAYLENNALEKAIDIFKQYKDQFKVEQILRILRSTLYANVDAVLVAQLVRELPKVYLSGVEVPMELRHLCVELLHNSKIEVVKTIISALPTPKFNDSQDTDTFGVFLLHEMVRAQNAPETVIEICRMLKTSGKNTRALHIATEIAMRRSPPFGLPYMEALSLEEPLRPHYFWPLMMYNFRRHGESGILRTLKHMSALQVECDDETLKEYVLPRISVLLEDPAQALKMLGEAGVKTTQMMQHIVGHLLAQHKVEEAYKLLELYPSKFDVSNLLVPLTKLGVHVRATKRYHHFAKLLALLAQRSDKDKEDFNGQLLLNMLATNERLRSDMEAFQRFITTMHKFGLNLSPAAVDAIQGYLPQDNPSVANERTKDISKTLQQMCSRQLVLNGAQESSMPGANTSSFIKHPRDMNCDELECHLIELEAKNMNTRGVLRRLLQLCVRDGRLERALEIKKKCDALKVDQSAGMLASIFDLYIKLKDLPQAVQSLEHLQKAFPGFQIDEHKIIDYAALLVQSGQLNKAKDLLASRAATQKINGGEYVLKNVWHLLNEVAHLAAKSDPPLPPTENLTRDTVNFLQQHRYCRPYNVVLGPILREYLLRGDIKSAVDEFSSLAQRYKHTPLQFELLSLLVRLSNGDESESARYNVTVEDAQSLLEQVIATITKVHGAVNMNSTLVLAFAESGTETQLRRLMINPEFRVNEEAMVKNCEHLGQEGAMKTLLRLARGSRGMHHVIDEQRIYDILLKNFVSTNNYEAALSLYERLEADDELKISQEFLRNLVNLLKINNVDVPSNIALRAQVR